jgi:hypothetical protein
MCALSLMFALGGCDAGSVLGNDEAVVDLGDMAEPGAMAHASAHAYPSDLVPDTDIDLWVSAEAAPTYAWISPDAEGSGKALPIGALIVRQVLDADGRVAKLTLMEKSVPEDNPTVGGWLFAVTDPAGVPLVEDGEVLSGALAQCASCHQARASDDYLFGVPADARIP